MTMKYAFAFLMFAAPAMAQSVGDCGDTVTARNLAEPWEANSATYAGGDIRVAVIDTLEPAAAAVHLMVLSPPRNEVGDRQCRLISFEQAEGGVGIGFFDIDFAKRSAEYDPSRGLTLTVPVEAFDVDTGGGKPHQMKVTINQSSGEVTAMVAGK